ncbi:unnamed protein product [Acanthoscelides obtectus]|uniref:Uncharacterized protein n=1 Tax=Acanthoscelides obtectus TaxID=200917 RepID=A0A9P0QJ60_ACAOB|nr:unnamed protein product [Acanthoscelides obtectus]CAK1685105.1 Circadian clock-controlled protein [Acanthoscelides obtectus]
MPNERLTIFMPFSIMILKISYESSSTPPEYILPCYKSDPEINKCLRNTFNHLRPYLKTGISDIEVPSIDPLKINTLIMENGRGPLRVKASFYNITTTGASNYSIGQIKTDLDKYIIELGVVLPRIEIRGKYDVNGNVLLFPVRSKGDFWAIFCKYTSIQSKTYLKICYFLYSNYHEGLKRKYSWGTVGLQEGYRRKGVRHKDSGEGTRVHAICRLRDPLGRTSAFDSQRPSTTNEQSQHP